MKKLLIFLGNPEVAEDFLAFFKGRDFEFYDPNKIYQESCDIFAYSAGCLNAILTLAQGQVQAENLYFISPVFEVTSPISALAYRLRSIISFLFCTPLAKSFVKQACLPQKLATTDFQKIFASYAQPAIWRQAIATKWHLQTQKMESKIEVKKIHVIYGDSDKTANWESQKKILAKIIDQNTLTEEKIADAGHALMWTHADALDKSLKINGVIQ